MTVQAGLCLPLAGPPPATGSPSSVERPPRNEGRLLVDLPAEAVFVNPRHSCQNAAHPSGSEDGMTTQGKRHTRAPLVVPLIVLVLFGLLGCRTGTAHSGGRTY